ncbi:MAG TPA: DUF4136 domain-containing protein [Syntrophales bacterium]
MRGSKTITRLGSIFTILLAAAIILAGCAASINYTYDPATSFAGLKSYNWATAGYVSQTNDLVVKNVQYLADQVLEKKGFTKTTDNPDMLIWMSYENEIGINQYGYQLRMLTLGIQKAGSKQLLWQGSATGTINVDAASGDLKKAVDGILTNFPPKK